MRTRFQIFKTKHEGTWTLRCISCDTYESLESQQQGFSVLKVHMQWWHRGKKVWTVGALDQVQYGTRARRVLEHS